MLKSDLTIFLIVVIKVNGGVRKRTCRAAGAGSGCTINAGRGTIFCARNNATNHAGNKHKPKCIKPPRHGKPCANIHHNTQCIIIAGAKYCAPAAPKPHIKTPSPPFRPCPMAGWGRKGGEGVRLKMPVDKAEEPCIRWSASVCTDGKNLLLGDSQLVTEGLLGHAVDGQCTHVLTA